MQAYPDRLSDWNMHLIQCDDVIFCVRIRLVQADKVRVCDELGVGTAEPTVTAGIMEVPLKLLCRNVNLRRILLSVGKIDRSPDALPHKYEHCEDYSRQDQQKRLSFMLVMPIGVVLISAMAIPCNEVTKRTLDQQESDAADNENCHEQAVNALPVLRSKFWKPKRLCDE